LKKPPHLYKGKAKEEAGKKSKAVQALKIDPRSLLAELRPDLETETNKCNTPVP
jgi:hypothetical protein